MSCKSDPQKRSPLTHSTLELLSYILSLLLSSTPNRCLHWRSFSSFSPAWLNPRQSAFHLCCSTKTASQKPPMTSVAEFNRHFQPTSHLTHQKPLTVPSFLLKHAFSLGFCNTKCSQRSFYPSHWSFPGFADLPPYMPQ